MRLCLFLYLLTFVFYTHPYPALETLEDLIKEYTESINKIHESIKIKNSTQPTEELNTKSNEDEELHQTENEYDFIIIGGGTSGAVLASRLTEIPEWNVLLLESGQEESKINQIPSMSLVLEGSDQFDWDFRTEPEMNSCLGMKEHRCHIPSGKVLGGTSSIDSMLYTRGNRLDYDRWSDSDSNSDSDSDSNSDSNSEGLQNWCYNHVLPYFRKSEDTHIHHFDNKYHQHGGPVHVENLVNTPLVETILEACNACGLPTVDYNGKQQLGVGLVQALSKNARRQSTATAFLSERSNRPNLHVRTECEVQKILIGQHGHDVKGVRYTCRDGHAHVAKSKRETILTAGPLHTPYLLMKSGVGPGEKLKEIGVPVLIDSPVVGSNLHLHPVYIGLNFILNQQNGSEEVKEVKEFNDEEQLRAWIKDGEGPMASPGHTEALAYLKTHASKEIHKEYPNIELQFKHQPHLTSDDLEVIKHTYSLTDETFSTFKPLLGHQVLTILVSVLHPKSIGMVSLGKNHELVIHGNQFSDPDEQDLSTMLSGVRNALNITRTHPFEEWNPKMIHIPIPGCEHYQNSNSDSDSDSDSHSHSHSHSDSYWQCAIKHLTTVRHPYGTCKMGTNPSKSVVDESLRVHGVHGLRIADNSVVPFALSAHTTAPGIMIAEKAADLIKDTWK